MEQNTQKPIIKVEYCPKCGWLMRAAWFAQELLTTFTEEVLELALKPSQTNGKFTIYIDNEIIFDRKTEGRFPEIKEIKQLIRDKIAPEKPLGHSDRK